MKKKKPQDPYRPPPREIPPIVTEKDINPYDTDTLRKYQKIKERDKKK